MPNETHRSLGHWCARIAAALRVRLDAGVQEHGLTSTSAIVLVALDKHGPTTLVELAHWLEHAHPSVLRQIDALEESGYVERNPHEHDRRMKLVHLTEKGERILPAIHRAMKEIQGAAMAGLEAEESEQLFGLLGRIASNLGLDDCSQRSSEPGKRLNRSELGSNSIARQR